MNKLLSFLFPVPYPIAAVWHIVLGAIIGAIIPQLYLGAGNTDAAVRGAYIGAAVGFVAGLALWLLTRNKRG